jgi:hypothetical protein
MVQTMDKQAAGMAQRSSNTKTTDWLVESKAMDQ